MSRRKPLHDHRADQRLSKSPTPPNKQQDKEADVAFTEDEDPITVSRNSSLNSSRKSNTLPDNDTEKEKIVETCIEHEKGERGYCIILSVVVIVVAIALCAGSSLGINLWKSHRVCSFEKLQEKHRDLKVKQLRHLTVGIENILNEQTEQSAVFLFVDILGKLREKIMDDIIEKTCNECLGQKEGPIKLNEAFFASNGDDYGHIIEEFKSRAEKHGKFFVVADLNKIPPNAARALHTICDTHSPIAKDAVIFLTLKTKEKGCANPSDCARKTLYELWDSKLKDYELDALITRLTDEVIDFHS